MIKPKQVIVVRRKYSDGKGGTMGLRAGKLIAQACHASSAFLVEYYLDTTRINSRNLNPYLDDITQDWMESKFTKVVCYVDSAEELFQIAENARLADLKVHIIYDEGLTEFNGVRTLTAIAIGPELSDKIDPVTANLKLY